VWWRLPGETSRATLRDRHAGNAIFSRARAAPSSRRQPAPTQILRQALEALLDVAVPDVGKRPVQPVAEALVDDAAVRAVSRSRE